MLRSRWLLLLAVLLLFPITNTEAQEAEKREVFLEQLRRILPKSEAWEAWLAKTGELPPDFDQLPRVAELPDPLAIEKDGHAGRIGAPEHWPERRRQLVELAKRYITGDVPAAPGNTTGTIVSMREEVGTWVQQIQLSFGPEHRGKLSMELIIPRTKKAPCPVFLTQTNHRGWALLAASRGYVGCVYAGADGSDQTGAFAPIWPDCDWTKLTRRAWAASRCVDYLETLDFVDRGKIVITGHSRNGKQAIFAGMLDERIAAVISSSSGAGGACTWRLFSESQFGEGIELITRTFPDWLHPRLRFFVGREDRLPIDQHSLLATIAPRACLIATAINDNVESTWAIQKTYLAVKPVYDLLGASDRLGIDWRAGTHETQAQDIERYLDWTDQQFGRAPGKHQTTLLLPEYDRWLKLSGEKVEALAYPERGLDDLIANNEGTTVGSREGWEAKRATIMKSIGWALGDAPPMAAGRAGAYGGEYPYIANMIGRSSAPEGFKKQNFSFGNYIAGDLYVPENANGPAPVIIWLHPDSFSNGYVAGYRRGDQPFAALAKQTGAAVFAYDQIGHGYRVEELVNFYNRYPHWSVMGKMVADARAAIDALEKHPGVDPKRIFMLGYGLGAKVALHAAALDPRVAGVASVAGFTPMRLDRENKGTGGAARWTHWQVLLPRLGAFVGEEARIPYDYHQLLALIAPRPALVVTPTLDRENSIYEVETAVYEAQKVYDLYGAKEKIQQFSPEDYNRYSPEMQKEVNARLRAMIEKN